MCLKTELLKRSPVIGGKICKNYTKSTKVDPIEDETEAFEFL